MRVKKCRSLFNQFFIKGFAIFQTDISNETPVAVMLIEAGKNQAHLLATSQPLQSLFGLTGIELRGFAVAGHLRRIYAGQAHNAAILQLHGVAIKTVGDNAIGMRGIFSMDLPGWTEKRQADHKQPDNGPFNFHRKT